jgi:hypothetical protein
MGMQSLGPALSNIEGTRRSGFILADCNVQKAQHHHLAIMQNNDIEKSMKFSTESCHKTGVFCIVVIERINCSNAAEPWDGRDCPGGFLKAEP